MKPPPREVWVPGERFAKPFDSAISAAAWHPALRTGPTPGPDSELYWPTTSDPGLPVHGWDEAGTFSIVAADTDRGFWGVAVSTHPMSVGAICPWAEWRVGAIATQARYNYDYGPDGLRLLRRGLSSEEVVHRLTRADSGRDQRQLGVVDRRGRAAAWTGKKCIDTAAQTIGDGFSCQGNMLSNDTVVPSMVRAFESKRGTLATRMLRALEAGAAAGGDKRGIQSAALLVVHRESWIPRYAGDTWVDLRVDHHKYPIRELGRLLRIDEEITRKFLKSREARLRRRRSKRA